MPAQILTLPRLTPEDADRVRALISATATADEVDPANDDAKLALGQSRGDVRHVLARQPDGELIGYAQLEHVQDRATAVLLVGPEHRRRQVGSALLSATQAAADAPVGFWAFHDLPAARALAASFGLTAVRTLLQLRLALTGPLPSVTPVSGVRIRPFVPGRDEQAWLALNARAFADHPEQGRMTRSDLDARMVQDWFDPAGFLVAEDDDGNLVGFHWTKRHSPVRGEVYVLGVDPRQGGRGLGTALLLAGLDQLQRGGVVEVILYVGADHPRAVRLYTGRGFTESARDVMYAPPNWSPPPAGDPEENE